MGILRKWFGPSKAEVWRKLSEELDARFVKGGFARGDKVEVSHGEWTLTLDTYAVSTGKTTVIFTRMRAPYVNPSGFRFTIYRKGVFSGVAKRLGMQDIEVGHEPFDTDFIIKGTSEGQVRELFANARLRELLEAQKDVHLTVKDDEGWFGTKFPDGVDELLFHVAGIIKDIDRLKHLYELFAVTLDELCRIGAAYENAPGVQLK
jgi:hypothetical protein